MFGVHEIVHCKITVGLRKSNRQFEKFFIKILNIVTIILEIEITRK
jgi:hypothetical protein